MLSSAHYYRFITPFYYNQLYMNYIVHLTSHTNYNFDAFPYPFMSSTGSSDFTIDFSENIQILISYQRYQDDIMHLLDDRS